MRIATLLPIEVEQLRGWITSFNEGVSVDVDLAEVSAYLAVTSLRKAIEADKRLHKSEMSEAGRAARVILYKIEQENDDDADYFNESVTQADDAFWAHMAKRYPEIDRGDFSPEDTDAFTSACVDAATAWLRANARHPIELPKPAKPAEDEWSELGPDAFLAKLKPIPDWKPSWEYPGFVSWSYTGKVPGFEHLTVHATPGFHDENEIAISVMLDESKGIAYKGHVGEDLPWKRGGRTLAAYYREISELLLRFTPVTVVAKYHAIGFSPAEIANFTGALDVVADGGDDDHPYPAATLVGTEVM